MFKPCGTVTGHGECCTDGWLCVTCQKLKDADATIERLQKEKQHLIYELENVCSKYTEFWELVGNPAKPVSVIEAEGFIWTIEEQQ